MNIKSCTKSQLIDHIATLEATALKQGFTIASLREKLAMAKPVGYVPTPYVRKPLPAHMAAARAAAMATRSTVLVTA